jgi:hypothetical protein
MQDTGGQAAGAAAAVLGESVEGEEYGRHVGFGNRKRKRKKIFFCIR